MLEMNNQAAILIAQAKNTLNILEENRHFYLEFIDWDFKNLVKQQSLVIKHIISLNIQNMHKSDRHIFIDKLAFFR